MRYGDRDGIFVFAHGGLLQHVEHITTRWNACQACNSVVWYVVILDAVTHTHTHTQNEANIAEWF